MKYPAHIYAKALAEIATDTTVSDDSLIARNFLAMVERNGDGAHLRQILEEAARFARGKNGIHKVILESARAISPAQRKDIATLVHPGDVIEETINPALIAGLRIIVDDERQLDGSLAGKLDKLFGNVS